MCFYIYVCTPGNKVVHDDDPHVIEMNASPIKGLLPIPELYVDVCCIFNDETVDKKHPINDCSSYVRQTQRYSNATCVSKYHSKSIPVLDSNSISTISADFTSPAKLFEFNQTILLCGKGRHLLSSSSSSSASSFISMNVMMRRGGLYRDKFLGQAVIQLGDYYSSFVKGETVELSAGIRDEKKFPLFQKSDDNQCDKNHEHHDHEVEGGGTLRVRLSMPKFDESSCGWFEQVTRDDDNHWLLGGLRRSIWLILVDECLYLHSSPFSTSTIASEDTLIRKIDISEVGSIVVANHVVSGEPTDVIEITVMNDLHDEDHDNREKDGSVPMNDDVQQQEEKLYLKWLDHTPDEMIRKIRRERWLAILYVVHEKVTSKRRQTKLLQSKTADDFPATHDTNTTNADVIENGNDKNSNINKECSNHSSDCNTADKGSGEKIHKMKKGNKKTKGGGKMKGKVDGSRKLVVGKTPVVNT